MKLDASYWQNRYLQQDTGWDIGHVSPPIKEIIDSLSNRALRILIPGCGKGYEVEYLHRQGFTQVIAADYAEEAKREFLLRVPDFPASHFWVEDFFSLAGTFDIILEQTFFCALDPSLRMRYVAHMAKLLADDGTLTGLLFNDFQQALQPPFGGSKEEYFALFKNSFEEVSLEPCLNSIAPRSGRELLLRCRKTIKNT
ncbi:MAG: TPMT family class I SAM-dependent methyltransferase [Cytophagaceae bacterium]|jgi:hypothetical protein|nr:TPMT family class I SAM-dependent methyltransferase [Cytophagaceae bacterium]